MTGPNSLPKAPESPRPISTEELVVFLTALVHQLGGEALLDAYELRCIQEQDLKVQIHVQSDPYMIILKEVKSK